MIIPRVEVGCSKGLHLCMKFPFGRCGYERDVGLGNVREMHIREVEVDWLQVWGVVM